MLARRTHQIALSIGLAAIVLFCFSGTVRNGFTGYDDGEYVTENPHVNTGLNWDNARWALTSAHSSNWHPLTWLSHAVDCTLFGLAPAGHHLTSLLLHALNTVLVFLWLHGLTGARWRSAFVALVFGLHPLHVESVAWVSARKDVLSTMFGLLALMAYTGYARKPGAARYCLVAALLAAGLMSKPMLVTLPLVMLLIDWWPLQRVSRRAIAEKVPLLLLAAVASAITIWAHRQSGSVLTLTDMPLPLRLSNAAVSYVRYLWKTVWPVDLAVFYPLPIGGVPIWAVAASLLVVAAITVAVFAARRQQPWLAFGWGWYLVTLIPVIGIVQTGMQAMADRYMYVPMIGLLVAVSWECAERLPARAVAPVAAAVLAVCAVVSWRQIRVWQDGVTLFTHALAVTEGNFVAHDNLGVELDRRGRPDEALVHYRETLRIKPGDRHGEANLAQAVFAKGERLFNEGRSAEALSLFQEGLRYRPDNALAHTYAGLILIQQDRLAAAIAELRLALGIDHGLARAHMGLGIALARSGKIEEGRQSLENSLRYDPTSFEAHYDMGLVQAALGQNLDALASFDAALRIKPDFEPARSARAVLSAQK